jgi:uncharacterized protein YcaQ
MQGSFIPLARTGADRKRTSDPRKSIDERYKDKDQYVAAVSTAARELVQQGYLLQEDLAVIQRDAGSHWDYVVASATPSTAQR